nr:hypothetical protein [Mycoplasma haemofelis]
MLGFSFSVSSLIPASLKKELTSEFFNIRNRTAEHNNNYVKSNIDNQTVTAGEPESAQPQQPSTSSLVGEDPKKTETKKPSKRRGRWFWFLPFKYDENKWWGW